MGRAMSGIIIDKIKRVLDEFADVCLDVESDRELIAIVIYRELLDDLNKKWKLPKPNYLKIDVDGIEYKIIEKSQNLLRSKELQSVLIEINPKRDQDKQIIKTLESFDFFYDQKQVDEAKRKFGTHIGYAEYLFYKK